MSFLQPNGKCVYKWYLLCGKCDCTHKNSLSKAKFDLWVHWTHISKLFTKVRWFCRKNFLYWIYFVLFVFVDFVFSEVHFFTKEFFTSLTPKENRLGIEKSTKSKSDLKIGCVFFQVELNLLQRKTIGIEKKNNLFYTKMFIAAEWLALTPVCVLVCFLAWFSVVLELKTMNALLKTMNGFWIYSVIATDWKV